MHISLTRQTCPISSLRVDITMKNPSEKPIIMYPVLNLYNDQSHSSAQSMANLNTFLPSVCHNVPVFRLEGQLYRLSGIVHIHQKKIFVTNDSTHLHVYVHCSKNEISAVIQTQVLYMNTSYNYCDSNCNKRTYKGYL